MTGERAQAADPVRDNLTQFPSGVARYGDNGASSEISRELTERRPSIADTRAQDLRKQLAAATADLARQTTINQSLAAKLNDSNQMRAALRRELESERCRLEKELAAATADLARRTVINESLAAKLSESERQLTDATTRADALQAALDTSAQAQAETLAEQQVRYEAIVAELVKTTNDQQAEYQHLLDQMTAAQDEQRRRHEDHEAELARERAAAELQRAESEARRREIEARLEAAEALCAAHDARYLAVRQEAEKLMAMLTSSLQPGSSQPEKTALAGETEADRAEAVA